MAEILHKDLIGEDIHELRVALGSGEPLTVPLFVGQGYYDLVNKKFYVAQGSTLVSDWMTTDVPPFLNFLDTTTISWTTTTVGNEITYTANVEEANLVLTSSNITDFGTAVLTLTEIVSLIADQHTRLILRTGIETNPSVWSPQAFNGLELDSNTQKIKLTQDLSLFGNPTFNEITLTAQSKAPLFTLTTGGTPTAASMFLDATKGMISRGSAGSASSFTLQNETGVDVLNNPVGSNQLVAPSLGGLNAPYVVHTDTNGLLSASKLVDADVDAAAAIAGTKINPDFGMQNITTTGSLLVDTIESNTNDIGILTGNDNKVISVGTGNGYNTINLGGVNTTVNISGAVYTTPIEYVTEDKNIVVNFNASGQSSPDSGVYVQEEYSGALINLTSAVWQTGNTVRYFVDIAGIDGLTIGEYVRITGFTNSENNGTFKVLDANSSYIDTANFKRTDASKDETTAANAARLLLSGYIHIGSTRMSWEIKAPAHAGIVELKPQSAAKTLLITSESINNVTAKFNTDLTVDQDLQKSASVEFSNIKISSLTTGIAHLNSSGDVSSSLIVNSDVSGTAAISGTKINPNFGNQNIETTGTIDSNSITVAPSGFFSGQTGKISLQELSINGFNSVALRAPDAIPIDFALTLPNSVGLANQILSTDGTGILSWQDGGGGLLHPTSGSTFEVENPLMTGTENTGIGVNAGQSLTSGIRNTVYGFNAGTNLTTGSNNVAVGALALEQENSGSGNIAIGNLSLNLLSGGGSFNLGIGANSGQLLNSFSSHNTFVNTEGLTLANTVNGTVAIGRDSAGNNATVTADNDFVLGTSNHIYKLPGSVGTVINLGPIGTGAGQTGTIRLYELAANGTNYIGIRVPDNITSNVNLTLPATVGSANQVLTTDGTTGALSWTTPSATVVGPIYSRSATGTATKIYSKTASDALATRAVTSWTTSRYSLSYNSVCWSSELGIFVAVGDSGTLTRASTSNDGIVWTPRITPESNTFRSVCWSPELGIFCAVSSDGTSRVMTSPDGINWTARTAAAANQWRSVCWSPELALFVAVSSTGGTDRAMYSADGITWTAATTSNLYAFYSVCWSSELGIFCAFASGRIMTSSDGINWTVSGALSIGIVSRATIVWSAELGIFCTASDSSTGFATSPDGITWTSRSAPNVNPWPSLVWSPELGLFCTVATNGSGNRIATSPNGITWTVRTSPADNLWTSICWSPELGIFCSVSTTPGTMISRDVGLYRERKIVPKYFNRVIQASESHRVSTRWTNRISATMNSSDWRSICWSPELRIFCAVSPTTASTQVATSPDGITWTARTPAAASAWQSICWSPELNLFVAVATTASTTNAIMTSPDGITWTLSSQTTASALYGVCWSPDLTLFVAVGNNKVISSPDGVTWTDRTQSNPRVWNSVTWSPELRRFCAVATSTGTNSTTVMISSDGIFWSGQSAVDTSSLSSVIWAPELGVFCARSVSTSANQIITSPDGSVWTGYTVSATDTCNSLVYSSELKTIIASVGSSMLSSVDARNWITKSTIPANTWQTATWSSELGIFVALSATGTNRVLVSKSANLLSDILNLRPSGPF